MKSNNEVNMPFKDLACLITIGPVLSNPRDKSERAFRSLMSFGVNDNITCGLIVCQVFSDLITSVVTRFIALKKERSV